MEEPDVRRAILDSIRCEVRAWMRTNHADLIRHFPHYTGILTNLNQTGLMLMLRFDQYYCRDHYRSKCWVDVGDTLSFYSSSEGTIPIGCRTCATDPRGKDPVEWVLLQLMRRLRSLSIQFDQYTVARWLEDELRVTYPRSRFSCGDYRVCDLIAPKLSFHFSVRGIPARWVSIYFDNNDSVHIVNDQSRLVATVRDYVQCNRHLQVRAALIRAARG